MTPALIPVWILLAQIALVVRRRQWAIPRQRRQIETDLSIVEHPA